MYKIFYTIPEHPSQTMEKIIFADDKFKATNKFFELHEMHHATIKSIVKL